MMVEPKLIGIANRNLKSGTIHVNGSECTLNSKKPSVIVTDEKDITTYASNKNYYIGNLPDADLVKWYRANVPVLEAKIAELEAKIVELEAKKPKKA